MKAKWDDNISWMQGCLIAYNQIRELETEKREVERVNLIATAMFGAANK